MDLRVIGDQASSFNMAVVAHTVILTAENLTDTLVSMGLDN